MKTLRFVMAMVFFTQTANAGSTKRIEVARAATFRYIAAQLAVAKTEKDFEQLFLLGMNERDRKDALTFFKEMKHPLRAQRKGEELIFTSSNATVTVAWPDISKAEFTFNGVPFKYDSKKPFKPQFEDLAKRMNIKESKNALVDALLPSAEAAIWMPILYWAAGAAGAIIVGLVSSTSNELSKPVVCWGTQGTPVDSPSCIAFRRDLARERQKGKVRIDAVKNLSGSDSRNILASFESVEFLCPSNSDGKDRYYRSRMRRVRVENGATTPSSDWFYVEMKLTAAGDATDLIVSSDNVRINPAETAKPENAKKLIVHIPFDPTDGYPAAYRVPDSNYGRTGNGSRGVLETPTVNIIPTTQDSEELRIIANADDITKYVNTKIYTCTARDLEVEVQAGIDPGSPVAPKTPETTK